MVDNFSETAKKIVDNYLDRLRSHLKGLPDKDREELVKEVYSHIYESYSHDSTDDEVERIFNVLNRLGEPHEVVASRVSSSMMGKGKKQKLPFYILAGALIGLVGVPLGLGVMSLLLGLAITLLSLVLCYYVTAITFVLAGWGTMVVSIIRLFKEDFLIDYIHGMEQFFAYPTGEILSILISLVVLALGMIMLWASKNVLRGTKFLIFLPFDKIKEARERRKKRT